MPHADRSGAAAPRRGAGELEGAVLAVLQEADAALSAGEVRDRLAGDGAGELAYSTVATIVSRLHEKGALRRRREGRVFRYAPVADEAGLAARALTAMLDRQSDRQAVLARFVADLPDRDEDLLRELLAGGGPDGS